MNTHSSGHAVRSMVQALPKQVQKLKDNGNSTDDEKGSNAIRPVALLDVVSIPVQ